MTLLKDLINIPEYVDKGQFVLRLTEGVATPQVTVDTYVPTPQLVRCFDDALSFIQGALQSHTSKATYLHGSFGSGKSHFMAILHLILQGDPTARAIDELAGAIQKHNEWISGRRFLLVPYHMIGAHDVESGILGGYVEYIRRTHPEAPIPGVYLAEGLFDDASALRQQMGDETFFNALNSSSGGSADSGWGDLVSGWDAARFEAALQAGPGDDERSQLISALVNKFFGSYDTQAGGRGEAFLSLDRGLSVISRHARDLGYDGLILFLDELILWLASRAADVKFVHQEIQKLAKLVESQTPDRPAPIVSFVARQRDLSELIGESVPGVERMNFSDALKHWEGRFHKITLEDRNLPAIAEKRVLKCRDDNARKELDAAFAETAKIRDSVMSTLLTSGGDREMFRQVYPFSPALVQTLIAVSSVLQRERTALRVMMQLLVDHRDTLQVGDIVPVGDLFDVIAHGDEAFSQDMAIHFDNAKRLYHQKLLPMLEQKHGRREELEQQPWDSPNRTAFRNEDRLIKTLLLSALVPEVESLRGLNAERLAALNHGTIRTPIRGREGQEVLRLCNNWAASVGEIRIGDESNPSISLQLSGVDTESIIQQAAREDNQGNRVRLVREMLFDQLGVEGEGEFERHHDFLWKNTRRSCTVLFRNIWELPDASFENDEDDDWKLVVDYPFDEPGRGPRDDLSKLQAFRDTHPAGAKTLCWIPQFFSEQALRDLGLLVVLEHILTGERFAQLASHLSPQDRQAARTLLDNQRSVLRHRVQNHLDAAYGLESPAAGALDTIHELEPHEQFVSLWPGFDPQPPVAANLGGALDHLLDQGLSCEFPGAPEFEAEVKSSNLKKVYAVISEATRTSDGRVPVDKPLRPLLRQIANPLRLGEMGHDATHFLLGQHWRSHFSRKEAEAGTTMTVGQLRQWIDQPQPMGLPREVQNLVILAFAEQTDRSFFRHGAPVDGTLTSLSDDAELREQKPPDQSEWDLAVQRAGSIFGEAVSPLRKASNVAALSAVVQQRAVSRRDDCVSYGQQLKHHLQRLQLDPTEVPRMRTATAMRLLIEQLQSVPPDDVVIVLAQANVVTTEAAMGECLRKAAELSTAIAATSWELFDSLMTLAGEFQSRADTILDSLREALASDEHVVALGPALQKAQSQAVRLLTDAAKPADPPPTDPQTRETEPPDDADAQDSREDLTTSGKELSGTAEVTTGRRERLAPAEARQQIEELEKSLGEGDQLQVDLSWRITRDGGPL